MSNAAAADENLGRIDATTSPYRRFEFPPGFIESDITFPTIVIFVGLLEENVLQLTEADGAPFPTDDPGEGYDTEDWNRRVAPHCIGFTDPQPSLDEPGTTANESAESEKPPSAEGAASSEIEEFLRAREELSGAYAFVCQADVRFGRAKEESKKAREELDEAYGRLRQAAGRLIKAAVPPEMPLFDSAPPKATADEPEAAPPDTKGKGKGKSSKSHKGRPRGKKK
jgi:hypothetical protein